MYNKKMNKLSGRIDIQPESSDYGYSMCKMSFSLKPLKLPNFQKPKKLGF